MSGQGGPGRMGNLVGREIWFGGRLYIILQLVYTAACCFQLSAFSFPFSILCFLGFCLVSDWSLASVSCAVVGGADFVVVGSFGWLF